MLISQHIHIYIYIYILANSDGLFTEIEKNIDEISLSILNVVSSWFGITWKKKESIKCIKFWFAA